MTKSSVFRVLLRTMALAAAYYAAGRLSLLAVPPHGADAALWPAAGAALAGLVLLGPRYWPGVALGAFGAALQIGAAPLPSAAGALWRALVWGGCAWALTGPLRMRRGISHMRDVLWFAGAGAVASVLAGAGGWLLTAPRITASGAVSHSVDWAAATFAGVLVVTPFALSWWGRESPRPPGRAWEAALLLVLTAVAAEGLFGPDRWGAAELPLSYAIFPLVGWAALRLGTRGTASLAIVVTASAMARVTDGVPLPFQRENPENALLCLQAYLSLVALTGLVIAALTADRRRALGRERRARREAERAGRRQAFLAEVGAALSGSLDYAETLTALARLCVPRLGDGCIVDEMRDDGSLGSVTTLHHDPAAREVLAELRRRYPPDRNPHSRVMEVCRARRPLLVREGGEAFTRALSVDAGHEALLRRMDARSLIFVPMLAGERLEGVLTLMRTGAGQPYGAADLALAQEVAWRAALCVENARLYRGAREEALVRRRVISMVTHEVRSPLSSIMLNASAVIDGSLPADGMNGRSPLKSIVVAAEQVGRLMQDLADVTRLEAGELAVERAAFSPQTLVSEARLLLEPLTAAAGVRAEWVVDGQPGPVMGDRERVLQVVANLVSNARRHTQPGGLVVVRAEPLGGEVLFSVSDTGRGIEASELDTLLRPLWGNHSRQRGMGLPLSRAIIEAQGGRMWAESEPGVGSRFFFTLPLAEAPARSTPLAAIARQTVAS
jgi:signal transduction histidine kinase/integral membrane sensor domain MASE1